MINAEESPSQYGIATSNYTAPSSLVVDIKARQNKPLTNDNIQPYAGDTIPGRYEQTFPHLNREPTIDQTNSTHPPWRADGVTYRIVDDSKAEASSNIHPLYGWRPTKAATLCMTCRQVTAQRSEVTSP